MVSIYVRGVLFRYVSYGMQISSGINPKQGNTRVLAGISDDHWDHLAAAPSAADCAAVLDRIET